MKKYKYLFFDLDGTLIDPLDGIAYSASMALGHFGIYVTDKQELSKFIGPPLRYTFAGQYGIPENRMEEALHEYRKYYSTHGIFECDLYENISLLLAALWKEGYKILLATSKPEIFAKKILQFHRINVYFWDICGATLDGTREKKEDVVEFAMSVCRAEPDEVLMIGDRSYDVLGAKAHGIDCAGVLWGYGSREELEDSGADYVYESVKDLARDLIDAARDKTTKS